MSPGVVPTILRRRVPQGFTPVRIPDCKLWFDMAYWKQFAFADGTVITTQPDLSGQGNDLTQATANRKPTIQNNVLNGLPIGRFDTTAAQEDRLATAAPASTLTDNFTMWLVYKMTSGTNNGSQPFMNGSQGLGNGWGISSRTGLSTFQKGFLRAGGAYHNSGVAADNAWTLACLSRVSGTAKLWLGGGASRVSTTSAFVTPTTSTSIGAQVTGGAFNPHDLAEGTIHNRGMSFSEMDAMGRYLANKWGLTWADAAA